MGTETGIQRDSEVHISIFVQPNIADQPTIAQQFYHKYTSYFRIQMEPPLFRFTTNT